ncbi:uncharacterized protein METZ01_LOCUS462545, partial [marine metagenome]
ELAIQAANDSFSSSDRDIIAIEVESLRDELLAIANTRDVEGNFIFSGSKSDTKPFLMDESTGVVQYAGDNRRLFTAVSDSRVLESNTDGTQVFQPVNRTSTTFDLKDIKAAGNYNFRVGDSVIEFKVASPLSATEIKASIESALASSAISSSVTAELVNGLPNVQLVLTGQAGVALSGVDVTQSDGDSTPVNVTINATSTDGVDFFKMLADFHNGLATDTRSDIGRAISELTSAQQDIAMSLGSVGSKLN